MKRRIVSVLMALVMALSLLPVQALAEDAAVGEPVTEIEQAEQTGKGEEPGDPEEQTGKGEEPGDPEEEQEPGEPEEPVREFVQGEAQLTVSTAAMAAGTAGERTVPGDIYKALSVGGSLKLLNDVEYSGSMDVAFDLVIDLNGYVLKMTGIKVENGGSLTIIDSDPQKEHKFTPNDDGLWVRDEQNGTKTVKGGVIYGGTGFTDGNNNGCGGGVYVDGGGTFTMEGGNIVGCKAEGYFAYGGGVFVAKGGQFTMNGGRIVGCTAVADRDGFAFGGGIRNDGEYNNSNVGRTTLSGTAEIRDCHAKGASQLLYGGGVSDAGTLTISGNVKIIGCTAGGMGSDAMYVNANNGSSVTGGTFYGSIKDPGNKISGVIVTYKDGDSEYAKQVLPSGTPATRPDDLAKHGYSFDGWYTSDGAQWDFTTAVTENITLTARWTLKAQEVSSEQELTAALADSANGVVRLTADITITAGLKITRDVTVDLNGHVLRYDEAADPDSIFRVKAGKTLTLTDSAPAASHSDASLPAGGLITGGKGYRYDGGSGSYHIYTYYGGGVYVEPGASFELAGGTIYACGVQSGAYQAFGGGIYVEGGSATMTGGAIRNCVVSTDYGASGGAIYAKAGSVTMSGGVISGCSAKDGGGILTSGCTVRITGGRIENCKASEHGGGLYISGHADQIPVLDAVISGCEAENGGGVALIAFAELELGENARITGCTATEKDDTEAGAIEYGAAIYMDLDSTYTVNYPGCFLYANGGRVEGTVYVGTNKIGTKNNYLDSVKATNAIDHTDGKPTTVFTGDVYCEGDIRGGIFHGSVTVLDPRGDMADVSKYDYWKFCSNLSGGSFYKPVRTECHVSGGTFYGGLTLEKNAKLSGKPMNTGSELTDKTNIPNPNGKPVTVTYAYGALGGIYAKQIVQAGETAKTPAEPTREGYTFIGWDKAIPATMPAENITITARWKDIEKPTGEIIIGTDKWQEFLNELTSGLFFQDTQEVTINAADNSGIVFASYLVTDQDLSEEELKSLVYRGYDEPFRIEPNGEYIVYVMLVDASLNITYLRSDRLTLDNVQPVISGIENGKTYCGARTVTITEKYIDTVTVNGTTVELDESDSFRLAPANGGQKIIVADKAGNTTEMTVTVNDGHTYGEWASNGDGTHTRKCTVDGCAGSETKDCSGGKATCRDKAKCAVCGKTYGKLDAKNHADLKHIPAKAATWVAEGNIEYWYCEGCGRYFSDRDGTKEIRRADTVTAKRKSSSAAAKPEDDPKSPGTGDTSNLALWIALLFASGGAAIGTTVVSRRKKYNR